jgi:hypothetical protein
VGRLNVVGKEDEDDIVGLTRNTVPNKKDNSILIEVADTLGG